METVQIPKANALKAYRKADVSGKQMLSDLLDGQVNFNEKITDRVKSFEDACLVNGTTPNEVIPPELRPYLSEYEIVCRMLTEITKALNEGVVLSWANASQRKWRPWFEYTASGFRFYDSLYDDAATDAGGGSRFCFATEELATYVGKQFLHLYNILHNQ